MTATLAHRPGAVFCVHDRAHRDRRVADAVLQGIVTVAGVTVPVGVEPDWTANPHPSDGEWRADWVKFYYGLDLAHAFAETGDRRYVTCWERLVASYMAQRPPGADRTEVIARRVQNWIYAWNRFDAHAPVVSAALGERVAEYLTAEAAYVRAHVSAERNHRTLELYAVLVAAIAFPERDPGRASRTWAFEHLRDNLLEDVRPDGVHREASTHYHCVALRSWLGTLALARQHGADLGPEFDDRLRAACAFAAYVHRPDGRIPACSDADAESHLDLVGLAATLFDRPDWRWIATAGAEGRPPAVRHVSCPDGGYYLQRSGWGDAGDGFDRARYLLFDCGPLGDGGHGHYDLLHVEIAAAGRPLLVDPGRYTYSEAGDRNWRHWFKGTAAHNTVTVDGLDQTAYARRKPKGPPAWGRLLLRETGPDLDVLIGEARSPVYDAVHTRTILFVRREYWVVVDQLAAPTPHEYQLRWHLSPETSAHVALDPIAGVVRADGVTLTIAPSRRVAVEPGWCAPRYGIKTPAAIVTASVHAYATTFVTVVTPREKPDHRWPTAVGYLRRGDRPSDRSVIQVSGTGPGGEQSDVLTWSTTRHFFELSGFRGVARAACVRRATGREPMGFTAVDVADGVWRDPGARGGTRASRPVPRCGWLAWDPGRGLALGPEATA